MEIQYERYDALDGVRTIAMIGILIMHVLANIPYCGELSGLYRYIVFLGDFTVLFMTISAFSVSCGYYLRIQKGGFNEINIFYNRRFLKILPFFATLTVIDVIISPSIASIYEGLANITLSFGLIPHQSITVIGVGWTLGVIFVFYFLYPFFVSCMQSKVKFFCLILASIFFAFICNGYFDLGKVDFHYCLIYFVLGMGIYLYRDSIKKCNRWIILTCTIVMGIIFFTIIEGHNIWKLMFVSLIVIYAVVCSQSKTILNNKCFRFLNKYSFEMYLCHMVAYRIVEKIGIIRIFENPFLSYVFVCVIVFFIALAISVGFKKIENLILGLRR